MIPQLDFVVCPLETETIGQILLEILPNGRVVHEIIHIQIEKDGQIAFGSYDNFHPECLVAGPTVPKSLLEELKEKGILRSFEEIPDSK